MANTPPVDCVSVTGYYGRAPETRPDYLFSLKHEYTGTEVTLTHYRAFVPPGTIVADSNILFSTYGRSAAITRYRSPIEAYGTLEDEFSPYTLDELRDTTKIAVCNIEGVCYYLQDSIYTRLPISEAGWLYVKTSIYPGNNTALFFSVTVDTALYNAWFDTYIKDEAGWAKYIEDVAIFDGSPGSNVEKLFLEFEESDGSQHFVDTSSEGNTISGVGNARIATAQYVFGGASCWLTGTNDSYIATSGDSTAFDFDIADFTLELWIRPDTITNIGAGLLVKKSDTVNSWGIYQNGAGLYFEYGDNTVYFGEDSLIALQWSHVAVSREGSHLFCSVNGTVEDLQGTSDAFAADYATRVTIGRGLEAKYFAGYLDNVKIYKGVAQYTADFNPYPDASAYITVTPATLSFGSVSIV